EVNGDPTKFKQAIPIGSGPFYYDLGGTPTTGEFPLVRNPKWHHEANRGWQIHVEQLTFKGYTDPSTAWLALKSGEIDCMMGVQPSTYLTELPGLASAGIKGFAQSTGFVYEFNLNQLTEEMRDEVGWNSGSNNPILLEMDVKKAFAKCIDKDFFVSDVLNGLGTYADSLIPDVNPWYHRYDGAELASFEPAQAREDLMAAGWKYDAAGNPADVDECPLYGYYGDPVSLEPLSFDFITLNDVPEWEIGASLIVNWTRVAGIELNLDLIPPSQMNSRWYDGDYDTWLWDWIFTPMSDPSTDVLSVLTTMEIGSWSDVYMSDPYFDSLYNDSLRAMDVEARKAIVDKMQDVAYEDFGCQCIAYRKELYAVSNERWTGYGDWEEDFMLMPDQCSPYLWMMISPFGNEWDNPPGPNLAPEITSYSENPVGYVNEPITFTGDATDTSDIVYKWWWGDGTSTGPEWLSDPSEDHTYTKDGYYTVYFAAMEDSDTLDYYSNWTSTIVTVIDRSNTPPHSLDIDFSPLNPDTGDIVTFSGTAVDDQDDPLNYSWSFGDVYTARGPIVTHQFATAGTYTVTMSVTDDRVGTDPRPVQTSLLIAVGGNSPPTVDVPDFPDVWKDDPYDFSVTASDPDSDPLTYTWVWGDGDTSVTDTDTATHTYGLQTTYTLEVFVDDGTGVSSHNVSDTGLVTVMSEENIAPVVVSFEPTKTDPYTGEEISFTGVASDGDGDALTLTFAFGDGTYEVFNSGATAPDTEVTFTATHTYTSATAVTARLYVWDNQANTSSAAVSITPVANAEPVVPALVDREALVNTTVTFTVDPYDPDGDEMSVCWEFGDGSAMENGLTVTHMYTVPGDDIVFRVYVDDGHGHNVTKAAVITILAEGTNIAPVIEALEDKTALVFEVVEFAASATDANDDVLVYTWDFGDDSDLVVGQTVEHAYEAVDEYTFTVYVDDGGSNETASATITVNSSDPPVADAGPDQTVEAGVGVSFDGSDSTDDVDVVNYTWAFTYSGSAVTLYGVSPEHTFEVVGEYNVTLTVKDAENQTGTDYVLITVEETDDGKSWIDTYGLPLGIIVALIVAAMVAVLVMKGRKGGKAASSAETEGQSMAEPEKDPAPPADEQ
ncbi:MAG: PKD domain-containing protein, partial [Thermoplasmata archaeon]